MSVKEVFLEGIPPWGFRMNGGADAGHPLRISRVNPGSKAESKGVREGDFITTINGQSTKCLTNSESHALLRTVKENLLLGLNEDKNSSPRRKSREIKSVSEGADGREKLEVTTQSKGSKNLSASQRRHQRRSRLKHRIKELFGFKNKKDHKNESVDDEEWDIIEGYTKDLETKSVISYSSEPEKTMTRSLSEPTDSEKIYDNFDFKRKEMYVETNEYHDKQFGKLSSINEIKKPTVIISEPPVEERSSREFHTNKVNITDIAVSSQKAQIMHVLPETLVSQSTKESRNYANIFANPNCTRRETALSDDLKDNQLLLETASKNLDFENRERKSPKPVELLTCSSEEAVEEELGETLHLFPHADLIEICNATVMIEDENCPANSLSTSVKTGDEHKVNGPFPTASNPDYEPVEVNSSIIIYPPYSSTISYYFPQRRYLEVISEENSDVSDGEKPWENSELIRKNNEIDSIPQDWFGSDQNGIDTSWREDKNIDEMSDIQIVSDSHSDSDLLDESKTASKNENVAVVANKKNKVMFPETEGSSDGNSLKIKDKEKSDAVDEAKHVKSEPIIKSIPPSGKEKHLLSSSRKVYKISSPKGNQISRKHVVKPLPSVAVVKNVVSSYYNSSSVPEKVRLDNKGQKEPNPMRIELNTSVIQPATEKDIELVYIDSSDSEAFSTISNLSLSNRTSLSVDKDETEVNEDTSSGTMLDISTLTPVQRSFVLEDKNNAIIKEVISDLQHTAEEICNIKIEPTIKSKKERKQLPPIETKISSESNSLYNVSYLVSPKIPRKKLNIDKDSKFKRRFSFPFSGFDVSKVSDSLSNVILNVVSEATTICSDKHSSVKEAQQPDKYLAIKATSNSSKSEDSSHSLKNSSSQTDLNYIPPVIHDQFNASNEEIKKSSDSLYFDFSEGSVSTESFYVPDITQENEVKDSETVIGSVCTPSPKFLPRSPAEVSDIFDLHQKFLTRRGYHENTALKGSNLVEPDLIALSKCKSKDAYAYTPELLAQAANLLALQNYHESRQKKMYQKEPNTTEKEEASNNSLLEEANNIKKKNQKEERISKEIKKEEDIRPSNEENSEKTALKLEINKSIIDENKTVGKSRLLELFQKLDSESSTSESNMPEPCAHQLILDNHAQPKEVNLNAIISEKQESVAVENACKDKRKSNDCQQEEMNGILSDRSKIKGDPKVVCPGKQGKEATEGSPSQMPDISSSSEVTIITDSDTQIKCVKPKPLAPGEILNRKMYEEYRGKIARLIERRNLKVIKISSRPNSVSVPSEIQPLESEFMNKLKERNEKLGIVIDNDDEKTGDEKEKKWTVDNLPKHLQELMEITEECGGVWSPVQTPEAERKKFDFSSEIREEKEKEKQKSAEEEEKKEPQAPVWTPRSAGASPTLERKYRAVNFQSPTPSRKEIKTPIDSPDLPKELPIEREDSKARLVSSSSENSTLSSALRLPTAQNPTITLLQKAREGQIPRGAQYLEEQSSVRGSLDQDEIIYSVKQEHFLEDSNKKVVDLGQRKIEGIGPTTREGIPIVLRSEVKEDNQQKWYKRMYDSLHKAGQDSYPYIYSGGYVSEPERIGYDSDASISKYATLDRRKIRNKENDFTTSTMPRNRYAPGVKYAVNVYKNQPGKIEDYEPGNSSIAEKEKKQWWDEVMDIFDGELNEQGRNNQLSSSTLGKPYTYSLKDTGYESDSTLVFKRRENNMSGQLLSPAEQKMAYKVIQKGGEVPLHGLRKAAPERPKEPVGNPIPTPPRDGTSRQRIQESPHRYVESEVNIHYRSPIRREQKAAWPEDELAQRQAEIMRRIYQEQRRTKYLNELHDMYSRRHADNLLPSQKSPIPLNRYDDFPVEVQPPRPRDRTPEPKLVARAMYNFVGQTSRELSFRRGDIIFVRRQIDKNWYEGEHNAMIGLFPFNYVEIIPYDGIRTLPKKASEGQARAKFNFQAQTHLELSLVKGELVLLTRRVDENWFEGRIGNRKGIFPVSYVEVLVEPGERPTSPSAGGSVSSKPIVAPASHSVMLNGAKDLGQQHYQPPRPAIYTSASLPPSSKLKDISLVNQALHIDTQSDPVPYRVMYNYRPQNEDELELKEGDVVYVMEKCDDGWYVGSLHRNGQFGTFPGNYVERIQ